MKVTRKTPFKTVQNVFPHVCPEPVLVKMFVFIYKWLQKRRSNTGSLFNLFICLTYLFIYSFIYLFNSFIYLTYFLIGTFNESDSKNAVQTQDKAEEEQTSLEQLRYDAANQIITPPCCV